METELTPLASRLGRAHIGLSAVILTAVTGRIAGVSGIAPGPLDGRLGGAAERPGLMFLLGLLVAPLFYMAVAGGWPEQTVSSNMTIAGLIFGLGLMISGMANPAKVLNFPDLAGAWDPSLAFVMAGAIVVALPGYAFFAPALRRSSPQSYSDPRAMILTAS